ncbi:uncharacterized protein LOC107042624 [Diachasma alloeum]|uniref:uncharacterized protein LOC107042624 n=1 Tax=Diachasma alloeum TaxID=454923 RepID=UPI00073822F0|nr:uncharacterized protein LOC107042624 [Diachasma alloeum]
MAIPLISTCRVTITLNIRENDAARDEKKTCGFHLTRSKWDPYPWVGYVEHGSIADVAGLKTGDCLLQIDQVDVVGLRVKDIASLIRKESSGSVINLQIWRIEENNNNGEKKQYNGNESGTALAGPLPILMGKFLKAISKIVDILECPVCLETATSPISQCVHGHILCATCRIKTLRCPVCRVRLGRGRCLIADEIQQSIGEAFDNDYNYDREIAFNNKEINNHSNHSLKQKLFGKVSLKSYDEPESHVKKYKTSFFRLFRGGFGRAVSADNLMTSNEKEKCHENDPTRVGFTGLGELTRGNRTKSASTGELCVGNERRSMINDNGQTSKSSVPLTPSWGGSMESISNNNLFLCPLSMQSECRESLTQHRLAEHLGYVHNYRNQMHFYGSNAIIPVSLSSHSYVIYIFHHAEQLFIFQYENGSAWMIGTGVNPMKWILHAWTDNKIKFKLERQVLKINDATHEKFSSHQAHLPSNDHSIDFIHIEIISLQCDGLL